MLPGFDAAPLKREFKRLMNRALPSFAASLLNSQSAAQARTALGVSLGGAGADIASAATLPIAARTGNLVDITGTVATSATDLENGGSCWCRAVAAWPLTYHATNMPLPGGVSYTCSAGDLVYMERTGGGVLVVRIFKQDGTPVVTPPARGFIDGLIMSTAGSSGTMSIAAGEATNSTHAALIKLASSMAKTTSAWAAGTGNGGKLSAAAIANSTWYYWYAIYNPSTGAVDIGFDVSATSPTLPSGFTQYRQIGAWPTNGSAQWASIIQDGDLFQWLTPVLDVDTSTFGTTASLVALSVPRKRVKALMNVLVIANSASGEAVYIADPSVSTLGPSATVSPLASLRITASSAQSLAAQVQAMTNTSAQVRVSCAVGGATEVIRIATTGWIDTRGRDA